MSMREQILKKSSRLVKLDVEEWGLDVWVPRMTLAEKLAMEKVVGALDAIPEEDKEARSRWMVRYVISIVTDAEGGKIFGPDDEEALFSDNSATAIESIAIRSLKLNAARTEDVVALGKASVSPPNGVSPIASPAT